MVERRSVERTRTVRSRIRWVASGGLVLCAAGIGVLWQSGVEFPVAIPPGGGPNTDSSSRSEMVFLLIGAAFVAFAPWRWAPVLGALLGALFTTGFVVSASGLDNLAGGAGAGVALAQGVQVAGALTALVAGVAATRAGYVKPAAAQTDRA